MNKLSGLLALLVVALTGACTTVPVSTFYVLGALPKSTNPIVNREQPLTVAVTLAEFPKYLDQAPIVRRKTENTLQYVENQRWAEPLRESFTRALVDNLSVLLGSPIVTSGPARVPLRTEHNVYVEVVRFDVGPQKEVRLDCRWYFTSTMPLQSNDVKRQEIIVAVNNDSFDAIVAAHSEAIAQLSRAIAEKIAARQTLKTGTLP